ncbi:MAG: hypothetical protein HY223_03085 [Thaumarchaeota archaeon]|nr:hypothetical protein [Nitrososphaerota archaeon]
MTSQIIQYSPKKSIVAGIIGGIAGGAAMYGIMSVLMTMIGMGPNCFAIIMGMITGQKYEDAMGPGIAVHFLTSIVIGAIFGAVISTKKLQVKGFGKGIGLGVATGIIAFIVIFLPIAMTVMPPHMMDLMKMMPGGANMGNNMAGNTGMPEKGNMSQEKMGNNMPNEKNNMGGQMNEQMMMEESQKTMSSILGGSFVSHIVFGAVLGAVTTVIVRRSAHV